MDNMHHPPPVASNEDIVLDEVLKLVPRGFKFHPDDIELIENYLKVKIDNGFIIPGRVYEVDVYKHSPQDLNDKYKRDGEEHIYFFTRRSRKYSNGDRPDRGVEGFGFWKATGRHNEINKNDTTIGFKRTLVFYKGKPKGGVKTNWIMQEFTLNKEENLASSNVTPPCQMQLDDWVLCKIYKNNREDVNTALQQPPNQHLQFPLQFVDSPCYPPNQHAHGQNLQVPMSHLDDELHEGLNWVPRGFKFYPDDVELIEHYLKPKIVGDFKIPGRIHEVDVYKHSPKHLNDRYKREGEEHIYFFTPRNRKYPNGGRPDRAVEGFGFWKSTGKDNPILINKNNTIGFKRTLVFHKGKPKGDVKTNWIMQEFTLKKEENLPSSNVTPSCQMKLDDWVLCKIYKTKRERESDDNEEAVVNTLQQAPNQHMQFPLQVVNALQDPPNQHSHGQHLQVPSPSPPTFESSVDSNSSLPPPSSPVPHLDDEFDTNMFLNLDTIESEHTLEGWAWWQVS